MSKIDILSDEALVKLLLNAKQPRIGIKGNTHFPFLDLNNTQIADLVSQFIEQKNLQ